MIRSTLALAYAQTYPKSVKALILRGIFLLRGKELKWLYQDGPGDLYWKWSADFSARRIFSDVWKIYEAPIPEVERHDMLGAYHRRLFGKNKEEAMKCAKVLL